MPIDSTKTFESPRGDFPDIPEGPYTLEIIDVTLGQVPTYRTRTLPEDKQEFEESLEFEFAILEDNKLTQDDTTRGRRIWKKFVKPYVAAPKGNKSGSHLYEIMRAIYGTNGLPEQLDGETINKLIGQQVMAVIRNTEGNDGNIYPDFSFGGLYQVQKFLKSYLNDPENPANQQGEDKMNEDVNFEELGDEVTSGQQ